MIKLDIPQELQSNVFGLLDENIKKVEQAFHVTIINRDNYITIMGLNEKSPIELANNVLTKLVSLAQKGEQITDQQVNYLIAALCDEKERLGFDQIDKLPDAAICMTVSGKPVKPKTLGQKSYIDAIRNNTIVFAIGPAGTGKTYLAMAMAITAFRTGEINRIILTRPAIEAGEKLGFLPGDLQQKVDPYLRPLYDVLHDIMGVETYARNFEKGLIEVAPLAYMRGRTLENSFIVLDEAQNTTPEQMKMFLTRLGNNSKAVITGDITQIDLPYGKDSGLIEAVRILDNISDIAICTLSTKDVVRHPLVMKIINAYDKDKKRMDYKEKKKLRIVRKKQ